MRSNPSGVSSADLPPRQMTKAETMTAVRRTVSFSIVLITVMMTFANTGGPSAEFFQYHPLMMTAMFVSVYPEVMGSVAQLQKPARGGLPREELVNRHQLSTFFLQVTASIGFAAVEYTKITKGYEHLKTPHAILGAFFGVALALQVFVGAMLRYVLPVRSALRPRFKTVHGLLSLCIVLSGLMCFMGGMTTDAAARLIPSAIWRTIICVSVPTLIACGFMF